VGRVCRIILNGDTRGQQELSVPAIAQKTRIKFSFLLSKTP